ncbi:MAG: acyl-CoA dehydratase activase [bacterium]
MSGQSNYFAGVDIGSRTSKAVIIDQDRRLQASKVIYTGISPAKSGEEVLNGALREDSLSVSRTVATGYGRVSADFADKTVTEITCHAVGVYSLNNRVRTIIDIGGQDSKVIKLDGAGKVSDFSMNDRCAAGTGKFLELTAHALQVELSDLGKMFERSYRPCSISSVCAVFAESEVVSLLADGRTREDIVAGVQISVARRVANMASRVRVEEEVVFSGGVARNQGITKALEEELLVEFSRLDFDPQLMGALGAAIIARNGSFS